MSYQNNRTIASMITGAIAAVAYIIYATGQSAPAVSDVRAWAGMMLLFIGIAVVASVIVQLVFHIALSLGIAAKNQTKSDREIKKIIRTTTREDEMEKSIVLKSSRVGYMVSGLGLLAALLLLAFGQEVVYALHVVLAACALGSGLEGIVSIYHYRKGL